MIKTLTACSHFTSIPETTKMTMKYKENKQRKMYCYLPPLRLHYGKVWAPREKMKGTQVFFPK